MIATIVAIAKKNSSAIVMIDGFQMIAAIAEKENEDRGDLRLTTSFAPFVKFNMAALNRRFLLEGCCCCVFQLTGKTKNP